MGAQLSDIKELDLGVDKYQLHRVMPSQLPAFWPSTKDAIARSLPHTDTVDEQVLTNIMRKIMNEEMVLWILVKREEGKEPKISLVIVLAFVAQLGFEGYKNLLIYALAGMDAHIPNQTWGRVLDALAEYGRMTGCKNISAVTKDRWLLELFGEFFPDGEAEMRVLNRRLED